MKDGKTVAVESAETIVEGIDRLIARRAELIAEYDRLGVILSEIRDKAAQTARKPRSGKFARPKRQKANAVPAQDSILRMESEDDQ